MALTRQQINAAREGGGAFQTGFNVTVGATLCLFLGMLGAGHAVDQTAGGAIVFFVTLTIFNAVFAFIYMRWLANCEESDKVARELNFEDFEKWHDLAHNKKNSE